MRLERSRQCGERVGRECRRAVTRGERAVAHNMRRRSAVVEQRGDGHQAGRDTLSWRIHLQAWPARVMACLHDEGHLPPKPHLSAHADMHA